MVPLIKCKAFTYELMRSSQKRPRMWTLEANERVGLHRGETRLDGAQDKKQVWPPCSNLRFFESKCTVLTKALVTLLGHFGALTVIRRPDSDSAPGELCFIFSPSFCPRVYMFSEVKPTPSGIKKQKINSLIWVSIRFSMPRALAHVGSSWVTIYFQILSIPLFCYEVIFDNFFGFTETASRRKFWLMQLLSCKK